MSASGAMSWMISATALPWVLWVCSALQAEPLARQNVWVCRLMLGTSPLATPAVHVAWSNTSTMPTLTPAPVMPAACHWSARVLADLDARHRADLRAPAHRGC